MSGFVVSESGRMLDSDVERIASIIKDYDERLELAWIPPESRDEREEFPFAVMYNNPNGNRDLVMRLRENEIDHRVLKRLFEADGRNGNVLDSIEAEEAARNLVEMKRKMDEEAEKREMAAWMIKARPGTKMGNGVVLE